MMTKHRTFQTQSGDIFPPLPAIDLGWKAQPKVRSLENTHHKPGGGNVEIPQSKLQWSAEPKVGSRDENHANRSKKRPRSYDGIEYIKFPSIYRKRVNDLNRWEDPKTTEEGAYVHIVNKKISGSPKGWFFGQCSS